MVHLTGPEGKEIQIESGTVRDGLEKLGVRKGAIAGLLNGKAVDFSKKVEEDGTLLPIFPDSEEGLEILRHSAAHLMAQAVSNLWPGTRYGVGPAIKDGF